MFLFPITWSINSNFDLMHLEPPISSNPKRNSELICIESFRTSSRRDCLLLPYTYTSRCWALSLRPSSALAQGHRHQGSDRAHQDLGEGGINVYTALEKPALKPDYAVLTKVVKVDFVVVLAVLFHHSSGSLGGGWHGLTLGEGVKLEYLKRRLSNQLF